MTYHLHEKHFANVLAQSSNDRLWYFIHKVADWGEIWGVRDDQGWLVPIAQEDLEYFPVWPHPEFAQTTANEWFPGHKAQEIDWSPSLMRDCLSWKRAGSRSPCSQIWIGAFGLSIQKNSQSTCVKNLLNTNDDHPAV